MDLQYNQIRTNVSIARPRGIAVKEILSSRFYEPNFKMEVNFQEFILDMYSVKALLSHLISLVEQVVDLGLLFVDIFPKPRNCEIYSKK